MRRSEVNPMPEYYNRYINLVDDLSITVAFDKHFADIQNLNLDVLKELGDMTYAPDKWTIKEIIQHLIDWERIFSYRSLIFARQEGNIPPGHDENILAKNSKANHKQLEEIIEDFIFARSSTRSLFSSYDEDDLATIGKSWNMEIAVGAVGFTIIGHQIHHFNIIKERYLPLLGKNINLIL